MDLRRPVQAVVPEAPGRVLAVLAETTGELSLRTVARLAEISPPRASHPPGPASARPRRTSRRPPDRPLSLVPENVASEFVLPLSHLHDDVLRQLGRRAEFLHCAAC